MTTTPNDRLDEQEVQRVLAAASRPRLPEGAADRLLRRLDAMPGPQRRYGNAAGTSDWSLPWLAGLPLAASLALGIYLGAAGNLDALLPAAFTGSDTTLSLSDDPADLGGLSDAASDAGGSLS